MPQALAPLVLVIVERDTSPSPTQQQGQQKECHLLLVQIFHHARVERVAALAGQAMVAVKAMSWPNVPRLRMVERMDCMADVNHW